MSPSLRPTPSPTEAIIRTPLARARGLGSAKSGTEHFWMQRLTGVLVLIFAIALLASVVRHFGTDYASVRAAMRSPLLSLPLLLLILAGVAHMRLGMQTIIEDYVHAPGCKMLALLANTLFVMLVGLTCVYAVLKLSFGA